MKDYSQYSDSDLMQMAGLPPVAPKQVASGSDSSGNSYQVTSLSNKDIPGAIQQQIGVKNSSAAPKDYSGYSDEDLMSMAGIKPAQNPNAPANTGFSAITQPLSDFYDAQKQRGAQLNNIVNATQQGQQSVAEGIGQGVMNEVGAVGQIPATAGSIAGKMAYDMLPQGKYAPVNAQSKIDSTQQAIAPTAQLYQQNLDTFNQQNPRAGRNFQAVRELSNVLPLGSSAVRETGEAGLTALSDATKTPVVLPASDLKSISQDSYKAADAAGGMLKPEARDNFINQLQSALPNEEDIKPGSNIIQNVLDKAKENAGYTKDEDGNDIAPKTGKPLSLSGAETIDKNLTDLINKEYDNKGNISNEGRQLMNVQTNLRDAMQNPSKDMVMGGQEGFDAYARGVTQWSAMRKMEDIENIFKNAETRDNPATAIKNGFGQIYRSPSRLGQYAPADQALIKKAATSSAFADYLRTTAGSRLIGTSVGSAIGAFSGPVGALVGSAVGAGVGEASRKIATGLQTGRTSALLSSISNKAVDNGTTQGVLYKYLGKQGGDAAMQTLKNGKIPASIGKLPSKHAKAIIDAIKNPPVPIPAKEPPMLALPAPRPDPIVYGSGIRTPETAALMDNIRNGQTQNPPLYSGQAKAPLSLPAPGYQAPQSRGPIVYGQRQGYRLGTDKNPVITPDNTKPLALPPPAVQVVDKHGVIKEMTDKERRALKALYQKGTK